jgi:hypothetical protein
MNEPFDIDIELPNVTPPPPKGAVRDLLVALPEPGHYLMVIDNSTLEVFERCPTAFLYHFVYRRQAHARNASLTFGGALHKAIESLERGDSEKAQNQAIIDYFTSNPAPPDEYRTAPLAAEIMQHYRHRCTQPDYHWKILTHNDAPLIECPFEVPLGTIEVNTKIRLPHWLEPALVKTVHVAWSGKMDVIAHVQGRNRVVDHKTTSVGGDRFTQQFPLSHQTQGYVWAAQRLYPQLKIGGTCINAIYITKPKNGTTSLLDKGPRGGLPALDFFRSYYDYTSQRLAEWERNCLLIIEDLLHCLIRNFYPMYTHHCFDKFSQCPYYDICTLEDIKVRHRLLMSEAYEDVTWSPLTP